MSLAPPQGLVEWLQAQAASELLAGSAATLAGVFGLRWHLWKTEGGRFVFYFEETLRPTRPHHGLTARECEVMRWVCEGKTNADISGILRVTVHTINRHMENVRRKLNVENRQQAILAVMQKTHPD